MENIVLVLRVIGATLICVAVWMAQMNERDICELQDAVQRLERREFYTIRLIDKGFYRLDFEKGIPDVLERETENCDENR